MVIATAVLAQDGPETLKDSRDGQIYSISTLHPFSNLVWMEQNLNYGTPVEGERLKLGRGQKYCYDDDLKNCRKYGGLYTWEAAKQSCPDGWRLPTEKDWNNLEQEYLMGVTALCGPGMPSSFGDSAAIERMFCHGRRWTSFEGTEEFFDVVGTMMKTEAWGGFVSENAYGFLPGGIRGVAGTQVEFLGKGSHGMWWTSSRAGGDSVNVRVLLRKSGKLEYWLALKGIGASVRCVKEQKEKK